jgi:hypothetical protein
MIYYVELVPTKEAPQRGCLVEVELPVMARYRKFMVKNNSHIRLYYETPGTLGGLPAFLASHRKRRFFLAPTGVECPEVADANYLDSVELYGDTIVFHIFQLK